MPNLTLTFLFVAATAALVMPAGLEVETVGDVTIVRGDLCAEARRIAESGPCLRPEDCGAFQEWRRIFGEPGITPLDPAEALGAGQAPRPPKKILYLPSGRGSSFNCPAPGGPR